MRIIFLTLYRVPGTIWRNEDKLMHTNWWHQYLFVLHKMTHETKSQSLFSMQSIWENFKKKKKKKKEVNVSEREKKKKEEGQITCVQCYIRNWTAPTTYRMHIETRESLILSVSHMHLNQKEKPNALMNVFLPTCVVHLKILKRMKYAVGISPKIPGIVLSSSDIDGIVIFNGQ